MGRDASQLITGVEKRNRGRKEADIELTIQQFSTVGSWLSHRDLGDCGDPWWGGCCGACPPAAIYPRQRLLSRDTVPGVFLLCRVAPSVQAEPPLARQKTGVLAARPRAERVVPKMRRVMRCADVSPSPCPDSQSFPGHQVCEHNFGIRIITQDPEMMCLLGPRHPP